MGNWYGQAGTYWKRKKRKRRKKQKIEPGSIRSLTKHILPAHTREAAQWTYRFSHQLFRKMTPSELAFWRIMSRSRTCKIYPQFPLYGYIVDFYCPEHRVAIELDGGYHKGQKEYDQKRDEFLRNQNICIVRFANSLNDKEIESYLYRIKQICKLRQTVAGIKLPEVPVALPAPMVWGTRQS